MTGPTLLEAITNLARSALAAEPDLARRQFLKVTGLAGGGMVLAGVLPGSLRAQGDPQNLVNSAELNVFVRIASDGRITIYSGNPEMGQGIKTALPMIVAEEMGANWEDVEVLQAPVDDSAFGPQRAGGSTTVARNLEKMHALGAAAREMLIGAGALVMEVDREDLEARDSRVEHVSGRYMTFGQLANMAAQQPLPDPDSLEFKDPEDYTIIGTSVSGVDNLVISTGLALYGIDTQVPGMLYAVYHKCPAIGGKVVSANLEEIKALPGVVDAFLVEGNDEVTQLLDGVAIVGRNTHAVFSAKRKLEVEWDERTASKDSWTRMVARAEALHGKRGPEVVLDKGDVDAKFADSGNTTLEAFYQYPFVSHLCLEPMNCTAHYREATGFFESDTLEVWFPSQMPARLYPVVESLFDIDPEDVTIHLPRLGGSFGRRGSTEFACEAVAISKRMNAPVKLTWTREDDIHHDFFRVGGFQSLKGAVDAAGRLVAFENHFVGMQRKGRTASGSRFNETEFPLQNIANAYVSKTTFDIGTPCGPWRAPGSNTNAFVVQSFLDELAHAAGRDYLEFLLEIMGEPRWFERGNVRSLNTGRAAAVIRLAAKEAGWGRTMPEGRGLGLAFYFSHAAHVAEVAEVSVDANRKLTVHNVTVAVDVGPIINLSGATSQVEGAVIDGLSTMMAQKITMENGRIEQSNLHDYTVLRIPNAPPVDIHFIQSDNPSTGLGEPALPPLAPAVGNAIFAATGHRVRKMPLTDEGYTL